MVAIDLGSLKKVGDSGSGGYYEVEPDLYVAAPSPHFRQTVEMARASLELIDRIAREAGRRDALIILIDNVVHQDAASRRIWRSADPRLHVGFALVTQSLLARAIGSFFIGLHRPTVPTKLFDDYQTALLWARRQVRERGGPI